MEGGDPDGLNWAAPLKGAGFAAKAGRHVPALGTGFSRQLGGAHAGGRPTRIAPLHSVVTPILHCASPPVSDRKQK